MISTPPIIIIGMHRSGTSLVTRLLEQLGLFVGQRKDENNEALFFQKLNDWLLCQSGGAWDQPSPIRLLHADAEVRPLVLDHLRGMMSGPAVREYLGLRRSLSCRSLFDLDYPWGWKDPRNTFSLPLWLDIFPGAKVVHVYRHGVAVAHSLRARRSRAIADAMTAMARRRSAPRRASDQPHFVDSLRCGALEGGLSLWEEYLDEARASVDLLGDRAIEVRYENLLTEPQGALRELTDFCQMTVESADLATAALQVQKDRAQAFRQDPDSLALTDAVRSRLARFGY